jgi:hypothetical protein
MGFVVVGRILWFCALFGVTVAQEVERVSW